MIKDKNPYLRRPDKPSYTRRAAHHDYKRPARYMITLKKAAEIPVLSVVKGNPAITDIEHADAPAAIPNEVGELFVKAMDQWIGKYRQLYIPEYVIMPDHIHFCLDVTALLPNGLGQAMSWLMGRTTSLYREYSGTEVQFFQRGYTDSIAYNDLQFITQRRYVQDNPRRLIIKRMHPDLFFTRWIITVDGIKLTALGNIFLLKNPHIQVVRFSRKYSQEQLQANRRAWETCLENDGVLISPFIHPVEKEMKNEAMAAGGKIIRIVENGFPERYSPPKSEFDMLGTGRLLLLGPGEYDSQKKEMKYSYARYLNSLAELLAAHPVSFTFRRG